MYFVFNSNIRLLINDHPINYPFSSFCVRHLADVPPRCPRRGWGYQKARVPLQGIADGLDNDATRPSAFARNHMGGNSATVAMLASTISGIPYNQTIHNPTGLFDPNNLSLGERAVRSAFTVCISQFCIIQCMLLISRKLWHRVRIVRCGFGEMFSEAVPTPIPNEAWFLFVGRLSQEKGILLLLEAVQGLVENVVDLELKLAGDGPLREESAADVIRRGMSERIGAADWLNCEAVRRKMRNCPALVMPSLVEGLPAVLMEPLALFRPVIAAHIAGIGELVTNAMNGRLTEPGSVDFLMAAIRQASNATADTLEVMGRVGAYQVSCRIMNLKVNLQSLPAISPNSAYGQVKVI